MPTPVPPAQRRKLIEVSLPLEAINRESAREKEPFTRRHPRSLHIWFARRPLVAVRAVLFAQLVDDPSCDPRAFTIDDDAEREAWIVAERLRLHRLIERLVVWENSNDQALFEEAHAEILRCTDANPPPVLDPFAGGGSIPLEAQRLGLEAHASDLNPVAVLINRALIEAVPASSDVPPVFPTLAETRTSWSGLTGFIEDVKMYGKSILDDLRESSGHNFPLAALPEGGSARVVAWIWARTIPCPNPACGISLPLVRSWRLSSKPGTEAHVSPTVEGRSVRYRVVLGRTPGDLKGTTDRTHATCLRCATPVSLKDVRAMGQAGQIGTDLMAVVAEGARGRRYLDPESTHVAAARIPRPIGEPESPLPERALGFRVQAYGFNSYTELLTPRQADTMLRLADLVRNSHSRVKGDYLAQEYARGVTDGSDEAALRYATQVVTYLALAVSRYADMNNSLCTWNEENQNIRALFSRQAVPMVWDFAEVNPLGPISIEGTIESAVGWISHARVAGRAVQQDAHHARFEGHVLSTDPPYYANIGYSDLSDFFYPWLRHMLADAHPDIMETMLVPKDGELVANPFRFGGSQNAKAYFERGFQEVFAAARRGAHPEVPAVVYYAYKQSDAASKKAGSEGWVTLLTAMKESGWAVVATWPIRSERQARIVAKETNALASCIALVLRARLSDAPTTDRRGFLAALRAELPEALRELQQGAIAPVDLDQAAIGPGMAVFTRYGSVLDNDGSPMSVRSALAQINQMLDEVLTEQENDFDADTRFALQWFRQHGFTAGPYGDAEIMANGRNANIGALARSGILTASGGKVTLLDLDALPTDYDPATDTHITVWEVVLHLAKRLDSDGIPAAAALVGRVPATIDLAVAKELTYLLFSIAEDRGQTADAVAFNALAAAWNEITTASRGYAPPAQLGFDDISDDVLL